MKKLLIVLLVLGVAFMYYTNTTPVEAKELAVDQYEQVRRSLQKYF